MAKSRNKKNQGSKPSVKVGDLKPTQDPKGGVDEKPKYLIVKLENVLVGSLPKETTNVVTPLVPPLSSKQ